MDPDAVPDDMSLVETGEVSTALKLSCPCFGVFLTSSWVLVVVVVFFVFVFFVMVAVLSILLIKKNSNN